jgi:urease accessory protein
MHVLALLLADGRSPTGGYAHSGGLEAAVTAGLGVAGVSGFMRARIRTVALMEATAAALAAAATTPEALFDLDEEVAARTPSAATRDASRRLGRSLLLAGRRWWPDEPCLAAYASGCTIASRSVALGAVAAAAGIAPGEVARISVYEDATTVATAASKLLVVDAGEAVGWTVACAGEIDATAARATALAAAGELPACTTPLLDLRAERHHHDDRRLFVS